MTFNAFTRKVHYWATAFVALPVMVILFTGLLLQAKKHWAWVQPAEYLGTGEVPSLDLHGILAATRTLSHLGVTGWQDINRIDVRPGKGLAKAWLHNGWEVQVDLGTGKVLHSAYRRSDLIESIHDGSWFGGDWVKLGLFLPAGIVLLLMWLTGLWMFWLPFSVRRRRKLARRPQGPNAPLPG